MEEMLNLQTSYGSHNRAQPSLAMHKDSHMISKFKPKIRIVHIFAPEIIKTDVANFRELVQRLTGKPTDNRRGGNTKKKTSRSTTTTTTTTSDDEYSRTTTTSTAEKLYKQKPAVSAAANKKMELVAAANGFRSSVYGTDYYHHHERVKEEDEDAADMKLWRAGHEQNPTSGFFGDIDGFIQGLSEFPLLPLSSASHMDVFGEDILIN